MKVPESFSSGMLRLILVLGAAIFLRLAIGQHSYSGANSPPMFGDYEAQRHWQEVTLNLPISEWYVNSSQNDLEYWGLDYPPLTAYHSLVLGHVARTIDPSFVALQKSRGLESNSHKTFMRLTVLVSDLLTYIPACLFFVLIALRQKPKLKLADNFFNFSPRDLFLGTILFYPGLILIDHGHFQYNCVSLGFFVAAVALILNNNLVWASVLFVAALNYKQMELYHALPFFFYILGSNLPRKRPVLTCLKKLFFVAATVILTMAAIWSPFFGAGRNALAVILRLFPLARGIFEDKVANVWCAINIAYKFRTVFSNIQLAQLCLISTTVALLPSCMDLLFRPSRDKFLVALINSSLAFFLFSYQVHEKSILLAAVPVLLHFHNDPIVCFWFLAISSFSMVPLLFKDGLLIGYFGLRVLYEVFVANVWFEKKKEEKKSFWMFGIDEGRILRWGLRSSLLGMDVLSSLVLFVDPPRRYPDLFSLMISVYSCVHFLAFMLYFNYRQIFSLKSSVKKLKVK